MKSYTMIAHIWVSDLHKTKLYYLYQEYNKLKIIIYLQEVHSN